MLDLLPSIRPSTLVVLELSSFQLSLLRKSPHLSVVTNISPNHLDRHGTMEAYVEAKRSIVRYQSAQDIAVLNAADAHAEGFASVTPAQILWFGIGASRGAIVRDGVAGMIEGDDFIPVIPVPEIPLLGAHNVENVLAAIATCAELGVGPAIMTDAIRRFRPAPHRLEVVGERAGVRYVDDSIATSPARAIVGIKAVDAPIMLIAGGRDKRLPWEEFASCIAERVRGLLLIGEAASDIERAVTSARSDESTLEWIEQCDTLESAVEIASKRARPGDVVLLSPACTSYDMFSDFEERGQVFARAVEGLNAA
jgi:UDP-N-acetylmuramoylalanine--D-glutamate ligase